MLLGFVEAEKLRRGEKKKEASTLKARQPHKGNEHCEDGEPFIIRWRFPHSYLWASTVML